MFLILDEHPNVKIKMIEKEQIDMLESIDIFALKSFDEVYSRSDIDTTKLENVWD